MRIFEGIQYLQKRTRDEECKKVRGTERERVNRRDR